MISARVKNDELVIEGTIEEGDMLDSICCVGHKWEARYIDPFFEPRWNNVWGHCENPDCPVEADNHWHGISNALVEDLALCMVEGRTIHIEYEFPPDNDALQA